MNTYHDAESMSINTQKIYPAEQMGLVNRRLDNLVTRAQRAIEESPLPSLQMALARKGKLALFITLGGAQNTHRYNIFSCTKPLVASAIWKLMGEGRIDISLPVCEWIPEFANNGKNTVSIGQLLCHTAGFPHAPLGPPDWFTRTDRLAKMQTWRLNWEPGSRMEYHSSSAHWVLAEIIERVSGLGYRDYIKQAITKPLGLNRFQLGVPLEQQADIAMLQSVGVTPTPAELEPLIGAAMQLPSIQDETLLRFNEPEIRALGVPGGGAIADAASVALFYQALLHNPGALWDETVLEDAVGTIRVTEVDPATSVAANRGLGVVIAGDDGMGARRGMGETASAKSFGHHGAGGQIAWADPVSGISFCVLTNGLDANLVRATRLGADLSSQAGLCHREVGGGD